MINLENVTLTYPDGEQRITALDNINLKVSNGEVAGITGESGSGKSSLLAVASSLITPDNGQITVDEYELHTMNDKEKTMYRKNGLGIIFQQANLIPSLTVLEQVYSVEASESFRFKLKNEAKKEANDLLELVGLTEHKHKRPHQLSGGQKQRVNIARALFGKPQSLIIDEPTSALDQERGAEIIDLIIKVTKEFDMATLLVTHDKSHLPLMDLVVVMRDGKIVERR